MTCCGHSMHLDGTVWVCGKCGAWLDPGTAAPAMSDEHQRAKEPLPIRPPRPHPQGLAGAVAA